MNRIPSIRNFLGRTTSVPLAVFVVIMTATPGVMLFRHLPSGITLLQTDPSVWTSFLDTLTFSVLFAILALATSLPLAVVLVQYLPARIRLPLLLASLSIWALPDILLNQAVSRLFSQPILAPLAFSVSPALVALLLRATLPLAFILGESIAGLRPLGIAASNAGASRGHLFRAFILPNAYAACALVGCVALSIGSSFRYFGGRVDGFVPLASLLDSRFYALSPEHRASADGIAALQLSLAFIPLVVTLVLPRLPARQATDPHDCPAWPPPLRSRVPLAALFLFVTIAAGIVTSLVSLFIAAPPFDPGASALANVTMSGPVATSVTLSTLALLLASLLVLPAALEVSQRRHKLAGVLFILVLLPLALPQEVFAYAIYLLTRRFEAMMGGSIPDALWLTLFLTYRIIPLVFLFSVFGFSAVSRQEIQAARNLGASAAEVATSVILPRAWPFVVVGLVLAYLVLINDYSLSAYLSQNEQLLGVAMTHVLLQHGDAFAMILACGITVTTFVTLLFVVAYGMKVQRPRLLQGIQGKYGRSP